MMRNGGILLLCLLVLELSCPGAGGGVVAGACGEAGGEDGTGSWALAKGGITKVARKRVVIRKRITGRLSGEGLTSD